eukprot:15485146-Alexandrium_andersonii.AAC.1
MLLDRVRAAVARGDALSLDLPLLEGQIVPAGVYPLATNLDPVQDVSEHVAAHPPLLDDGGAAAL